MQSLFFWKDWPRDYRYIWYLTAAVFVLALVFLWICYFTGINTVIQWDKFQEQEIIETTIHTFQSGPFSITIPAENYVIFEYFNGSDLVPNVPASLFFLGILAIASVILVTVITTLERFWYLAGMTLFILFFISLRLEVIRLFGSNNYYPSGLILAFFIGASLYFNMFRPATRFIIRLAVFSTLSIATAVIIYFFASVNHPFLYLTVTSYTSALILTVLFIIIVSHEILAFFIVIASQGTRSQSLKHFLIISAIYLINLGLTYLHQTGYIAWNFVYVNVYLLFTFSAILGIWGFRQRESLYGNIIPFHPFGAFLFTMLGAIAFATTGAMLGNANDAALRVIEDVILFSHLGFGFLFVLYVVSNFASMMIQSLPVLKVLYKPVRMPYFIFQFAGIIATLGFVFYTGWRIYVYVGVGGFYNNLADVHTTLNNDAFARAHYEKARTYAFQNHHANYALAKLKSEWYDFTEAHYHYDLANDGKPSAFSLANAGNLFIWEDEVFKAIEAYREAKKKRPQSGIIDNNLGFAFGKIHNVDSSVFYLSKALKQHESRRSAEANFFALAAHEYLPVRADSILRTFDTAYTATKANALALATSQHQNFSFPLEPLQSKRLDLYSATLLNNFIIHHVKEVDTLFINEAYRIADDSLNEDYSEALKIALAQAYYHQSNVSKALEIMAELAYISQSYEGKYNYLMGLWALEQGNAPRASAYFNQAIIHDYKDAALYHAVALSESGLVKPALAAWDTISSTSSLAERREMAAQMKRLFTTGITEAHRLPDAEKYQFAHYRLNVLDTTAFDRLAPTFQNNDFKAMALLEMAQRQFAAGNISATVRYLNKINGLELTSETLYEAIRHTELLILAERGGVRELSDKLKEVTFRADQKLERMLCIALIQEAEGDTVAAEKNYRILAAYNPYFEEGVIAAAEFYRHRSDDPLAAYSILAEAIQVNDHSIKLLRAYITEARNAGFVEFAEGAREQLEDIYRKLRPAL